MKNIEGDPNYLEGKFTAEKVLKDGIEKTMYQVIESAVNIKKDIVETFEKEFQFDRDTGPFDRNYAFNCGMLGGFTKHQGGKKKGNGN